MSYTAPMTKRPPLGIRFEDQEQGALERAAKADQRPISAMGRKIITDYLRANGWLPDASKPTSKPPGEV